MPLCNYAGRLDEKGGEGMANRWVLSLLVGGPLGFAAAMLIYQAWVAQKQAWAARQWPQTSGLIISSQVKVTRVRERRRSGFSRTVTRYEPNVIYRYQANGGVHQSNQLYLGQKVLYSDTAAVEKILLRYPAGDTVTVYYDPDHPATATLSPKTGWATTVMWLMGTFLFFMAGMVAYAILNNGS